MSKRKHLSIHFFCTHNPAMFWGRELPHFMEHQRIAVNEEMWRFRWRS